MPTLTNQPIVVGDTINFCHQFWRNGAIWDISGATITLRLIDPSNNVSTHTAAISDASQGLAHFQVADTVLDEPSTDTAKWGRQWEIIHLGVQMRTRIKYFDVYPLAT